MKHWTPIPQGTLAQNGDRYYMGAGRYAIVGSTDPSTYTFVTAGMPWPDQCMCYRPERFEDDGSDWPGNMPPAINWGAMHAELPHRRRT